MLITPCLSFPFFLPNLGLLSWEAVSLRPAAPLLWAQPYPYLRTVGLCLSYLQTGTTAAGAAVSASKSEYVCCAQNHTTFVPNVAVRFDYALTGVSATGAPVSPLVSIYYTDRTSDATFTPAKTNTVNLVAAQGVSHNAHCISHPRPLVTFLLRSQRSPLHPSIHYNMSTMDGSFRPSRTPTTKSDGRPIQMMS